MSERERKKRKRERKGSSRSAYQPTKQRGPEKKIKRTLAETPKKINIYPNIPPTKAVSPPPKKHVCPLYNLLLFIAILYSKSVFSKTTHQKKIKKSTPLFAQTRVECTIVLLYAILRRLVEGVEDLWGGGGWVEWWMWGFGCFGGWERRGRGGGGVRNLRGVCGSCGCVSG